MNSTQFSGNVGQDPEIKEVGSNNTEVMNFSIFVKVYKKGAPKNGFWLNVTHFKPNDYLKDLVKKGVPVAISGRLDISNYNDKWYTKCMTHEINVFPKGTGDSTPRAMTDNDAKDPEDDLPF